MTKNAAKLLAEAARLAGDTAGQLGRLVAAALDAWHEDVEPEQVKPVDERDVEMRRTRERLRRRGHNV